MNQRKMRIDFDVFSPFNLFFLFLVIAETGMLTFWRNAFGHYGSPVVFFLVSLVIPLLFVFYLRKNQDKTTNSKLKEKGRKPKQQIVFGWLIFTLGVIVIFIKLQALFAYFPIDRTFSDIIPATLTYVDRFLSGEKVYQQIGMGDYVLQPKYLPMRWAPYLVSSSLGFDTRWMAIVILMIGFGVQQFHILKTTSGIFGIILKSALPFAIVILLIAELPHEVAQTLEFMIAGYYLLLFFSLISKSSVVRIIGLSLCFLSRISFIFWAPLYFIISFYKEKKRKSILISAGVLVAVILLFFLPFGKMQPQFAIKFWKYYQNFEEGALNQWKTQEWQNPEHKPYQLFRGIGFACYFYDLESMEPAERLQRLKKVSFFLSIVVIFLCGLFYWKNRNSLDHQLYLAAALKIYFAFLFSFIYVPFLYLYFVPVLLSSALYSTIIFQNAPKLFFRNPMGK